MSQDYADLPEMNMPFNGAKLALIVGARVITILRDVRPDIPYPNHWDLPGGGREGMETPVACALRETHEELGLVLDATVITWGRAFVTGLQRTWFFVGHVPENIIDDIVFGDEGQYWQMMGIETFVNHPQAVPNFKTRVGIYVAEQAAQKKPPLF